MKSIGQHILPTMLSGFALICANSLYEKVLICFSPTRKETTYRDQNQYLVNLYPRGSIHFLVRCCNFWKPLKKKFRDLLVQPFLRGRNDLSVVPKVVNIQLFFQSWKQVEVRRDQIRRIGCVIKCWCPDSPVPSELQVASEKVHCRTRTRHIVKFRRCFSFKISFNCTRRDG